MTQATQQLPRPKVPTVVADYFQARGVDTGDPVNHPVIICQFKPIVGWIPCESGRVSATRILKMRRELVTAVVLDAGGHQADFTVDEILHNQSLTMLDAEFRDGVAAAIALAQ
jgi:hypothetical protein